MLQCIFPAKSFSLKFLNKQISNAKGCCPCSKKKDPLFTERLSRKPACCNDPGSGYCCSTLDIVIIRTDLITVLIQDTDRINTGEVFPLDTNFWKNFINCFYKGFHKFIKFLSPDPLSFQAGIK